MPGGGGFIVPPTATVGRNPANGVVIYYSLKTRPTTEVALELLDPAGQSIRKVTTRVPRPQASPAPGGAGTQGRDEAAPAPAGEESEGGRGGPQPRLSFDVGLNRFVWDMRYTESVRFPGMILWSGETRGPRVAPGIYQMKLTVDGQTSSEKFEVKADPRLQTTAAEYARQLELSLKIRDKLSEVHKAIIEIRDLHKQVDDLLKRVKNQPNAKPINEAGAVLNKSLVSIEEALYQTRNQSSQDPLNFPIRLNNKLAALGGVVGGAEAPPTDQSYLVFDALVVQIDAQLQKLAQLVKTDVPAFNRLVRDQSIPAIIVQPPAERQP